MKLGNVLTKDSHTQSFRKVGGDKTGFTPCCYVHSGTGALAVLQEAALPTPWNRAIYSHTIIINKAVYTLRPWPCIS